MQENVQEKDVREDECFDEWTYYDTKIIIASALCTFSPSYHIVKKPYN